MYLGVNLIRDVQNVYTVSRGLSCTLASTQFASQGRLLQVHGCWQKTSGSETKDSVIVIAMQQQAGHQPLARFPSHDSQGQHEVPGDALPYRTETLSLGNSNLLYWIGSIPNLCPREKYCLYFTE